MNGHDLQLLKDRVWELVRAQTGLGVRQHTVNPVTVRVAERIHGVFNEGIRLDVQEQINR
jgi:hypothetical protein